MLIRIASSQVDKDVANRMQHYYNGSIKPLYGWSEWACIIGVSLWGARAILALVDYVKA